MRQPAAAGDALHEDRVQLVDHALQLGELLRG
jgi:hypothetical protein